MHNYLFERFALTMRTRGQIYWDWAHMDLHVRNHDERLSDGTLINIQTRHSPISSTQLLVSVYGKGGAMIFEEIYDTRPGETMTQAIAWGVSRAKKRIGCGASPSPRKPESLPRKGSRRYI